MTNLQLNHLNVAVDEEISSTPLLNENGNLEEGKSNDSNNTLAISANTAKDHVLIKIKENILIKFPTDELKNKVIAENTFINPKYVSNEEHGYSNWNVDPYIETYQVIEDGLIVPLGFGAQLLKLCKEENLDIEFEDQRTTCHVSYPDSLNEITLRSYQNRVVGDALNNIQGTIVAPTVCGKSLIGLEIIRRRQQKALIIVHRSDLAEQWINVIKLRLGIIPGQIGDGKWDVGNEITVAMVQTLASRQDDTKTLSDEFGIIIAEECHHLPSETFFETIGMFNAKYRYGLSATIDRRDGLMPLIFLAAGPLIACVERKEVEALQATVPASVISIETKCAPEAGSWNEYIDAICTNADRNLLIFNLATNSNVPTLILTDRIAHAEDLSDIFSKREIQHVLVHGQLKNRDEAMNLVKSVPITIGTTGLLGEGLDIPFWEVLIMASPISSEIKLMQAIGRVIRASEGKKRALVYDLRDDCGFSGSSFKKRFAIYKKHNIWVKFSNDKIK